MARKAENKLALIPILFILLRMWGTLQFLFSIIVYGARLADTTGCIPKAVYYVYLVLTCAQVGDRCLRFWVPMEYKERGVGC